MVKKPTTPVVPLVPDLASTGLASTIHPILLSKGQTDPHWRVATLPVVGGLELRGAYTPPLVVDPPHPTTIEDDDSTTTTTTTPPPPRVPSGWITSPQDASSRFAFTTSFSYVKPPHAREDEGEVIVVLGVAVDGGRVEGVMVSGSPARLARGEGPERFLRIADWQLLPPEGDDTTTGSSSRGGGAKNNNVTFVVGSFDEEGYRYPPAIRIQVLPPPSKALRPDDVRLRTTTSNGRRVPDAKEVSARALNLATFVVILVGVFMLAWMADKLQMFKQHRSVGYSYRLVRQAEEEAREVDI